jgi:hypothetical protein
MVTQKDDLGCGVASVAYILNVSYEDALELFDINKVKTEGCYCKDIVSVLKARNIYARFNYVKRHLKPEIYKLNTIVFIKRCKRYPAGHYLARTQNGWHDSWINFSHQKDIRKAESGIRKRLPGKVIYAIFIDS